MIAADDPRHGTSNAYTNLGCRCDACREAKTEYVRSRQIGAYRRRPCPVCWKPMTYGARMCDTCLRSWTPAHGTESCYRRGCRCDECRAAAASARRRRRHADIMAARAYDRAYQAAYRAKKRGETL